jgi:CDP-diacylglycerol--glycerol-3-phosphate 3-phosphatidyltransferase
MISAFYRNNKNSKDATCEVRRVVKGKIIMPSIYDLKPRFQAILRPLVRGLASAGVSANQVTILAVIVSAVTGFFVYKYPTTAWALYLVPAVLFIRMALNAIDGMLAREHDMKSPLGAILNELGDVVSDTVLYLPLVYVPGVPALYIVLIVTLSIISEMTGVVAIQIGAQRRYDGPMGKSDRAFAFGLLALLIAVGIAPGPWTVYYLAVMAVLLCLTVINRARCALKEIRV